MPKAEKSSSDPKGGNFVPVTVAVIGALAVLLSAALANWDKIFPSSSGPPPGLASVPTQAAATPQSFKQATSGSQSPAVSGVRGDVTINFGRPESNQSLTGSQRAAVDGEWQTATFLVGGYPTRLYFRLETLPDGRILGMAQYVDAGHGNRIGPEFGITDGKTDGHSIAVSFFGGGKSRDASGELTIPTKETLFGELGGTELQLQYQYSDMAPVETVARRMGPAVTVP